jgi:hypothetical protein
VICLASRRSPHLRRNGRGFCDTFSCEIDSARGDKPETKIEMLGIPPSSQKSGVVLPFIILGSERNMSLTNKRNQSIEISFPHSEGTRIDYVNSIRSRFLGKRVEKDSSSRWRTQTSRARRDRGPLLALPIRRRQSLLLHSGLESLSGIPAVSEASVSTQIGDGLCAFSVKAAVQHPSLLHLQIERLV